jgi:hypothetical protein
MASTPVVRSTCIAAAALFLLSAACPPDDRLVPENAQVTVNAVSNLNIAPLPEHLMAPEPARRGDEFDVSEYFSVLDHLSVRDGYIVNWIYRWDTMGGAPCLYSRPVSEPPYRIYADYRDAFGDIASEQDSERFWYGYLDQVESDGTPEGFFQFVVLRIMGGQFYLSWHDNYNDRIVVCDHTGVEAALARARNSYDLQIPDSVREDALSLDLAPTVAIGEDTVLVRVVIFTKWGGFIEEKYTLERNFPHSVLQVESDTLMVYDCGFIF